MHHPKTSSIPKKHLPKYVPPKTILGMGSGINLVIRDFGGNVNLVIWAIDSGILRAEYSA